MKKKIFIDGAEGTTGLRLRQRLESRDDIEIITVADESLRKDAAEKKRCISLSDVTFFCLPDAAASEDALLCDNENTVLIDASTAHRTESGWVYGFPELHGYREKIRSSKRIAVPGCHASGYIAAVFPLVEKGVLKKDAQTVCFSLTGYSGGGKKMIAEYESGEKRRQLYSPRIYGTSQTHKHLREMKFVSGLEKAPVFVPTVDDYYSGMLTTIPLTPDMMSKSFSKSDVTDIFKEYYSGQKLVRVLGENDAGDVFENGSFLDAGALSGKDLMYIYVSGNDERMTLHAVFDNLGKGASGAAVQCMNIVLGADEASGLDI